MAVVNSAEIVQMMLVSQVLVFAESELVPIPQLLFPCASAAARRTSQ